ncbi:MAG TPA: hypothetical protein VF042_01860 [Gemmatimonadaceae bacterium]
MLPPDVKDAELDVIRAATRTTMYDSIHAVPLRQAVYNMTRLLKSHGVPPERAYVYLKGAAFKARLAHAEIPAEGAEMLEKLISRMLRWFLEAYYEEEHEPALT